jgi:hypothetical protein
MKFFEKLFLFLFGVVEDLSPQDVSNKMLEKSWGNIFLGSNNELLFTSNITNEYFPLPPGTILNFVGKVEEGTPASSTFDMTFNHKQIMGIDCLEVHETFFVNEYLKEEKLHWFAQDIMFGTVWYFGQDYKLFNKQGDVISTGSSWLAGENFSFPGAMMKGTPAVGDHYYQEYAPGKAEDEARVLSMSESVSVPFAHYEACLMTLENSVLQQGMNTNMYYAKGVGLVRSLMVSGGKKLLELESISHYH